MMVMKRLAELIQDRNNISEEIAKIINRPALNSHIGEYIASQIFDISLNTSANVKGMDGLFKSGSLRDKSVNVKLYGKKENILDISPGNLADYYLVISGDTGDLLSSRGKTRPLNISQVFLFNMNELLSRLRASGVKIGIATSIRKSEWEKAMLYPVKKNMELVLSKEQVELLRLFDNKVTKGES
jgi:hypothetical protein